MVGMKVHELAREFGISSKEMLVHLKELGIPARGHATNLVPAYVDIVRSQLAHLKKENEAEIEALKAEEEAEAKRLRLEEEERERKEAQAREEAEKEELARREARRKEEEKRRAAARKKAEEAKKAEEQAKQEEVEVAPAAETLLVNPVADALGEDFVEAASKVVEAVDEALEAKESKESSELKDEAKKPAKKEPKKATTKKASKKAEPNEEVEAKEAKDDLPEIDPSLSELEKNILLEQHRLEKEKEAKKAAAKKAREEKAAKAKAAKAKAEEAKKATKASKPAKKERLVRAEDPIENIIESPLESAQDDAEYYASMAKSAEEYKREKILEQMRREVEEQNAASKSRKKKKKSKAEKAEEKAKEVIPPQKSEIEGLLTSVPTGSTVQEVAELLQVQPNDVIKRLFMLGTPLTLTQTMSDELIELIADDMGRKIVIQSIEDEMSWTFEDDEKDLTPRSPVVTVMGHVDHGKTSLLDAIRETGIVATEAGGITQHIGASVVSKNGRTITFIDTPGHEAFTAMRARGANITDVVILVVAADDGVMPQTIEAISHAKAADVPIIVAVNKIDKDTANPDRVKQMLAEHDVIPEDWGGKNIFVEVSAKQRLNIDELLEMVLLQADILELKANANAPGYGTVVEAKLDKGRGPVATVLVRRGTLRVGDTLVAGTAFGRVRALLDPLGELVEEAGPSEPVEILGLGSVPSAGDEFLVFDDERKARAISDERAMKQRVRDQERTANTVSLDNIFTTIQEGQVTRLNLIVKADVHGSIEALRDSLDKMDQSEVIIDIIHAAVGGVTETDVQLATASNAIIIGFNVRPTPGARDLAVEEQVDIRLYRVIYEAIEEINAARVGLLAPEFVEEDTARVEVRDLFKVPRAGTIAGCYVLEGEISRDEKVRLVRDGVVVYEGKIGSLRRFKDDVRSVRAGYECGIGIEGYNDIKVGDIIESYKIVELKREA